MDAPVKERLTGALILVAAVWLIVPEILSGPESKPVAAAIMPAQPAEAGAPLRTYSMSLGDASDPAASVAPAPASSPQPAVAPVETTAPVPVVETTQAAAVTAVPAAPVVAEKPNAAAPAPSGKWWVQIGVYSSKENADRLARQLRAAGLDIDLSSIKFGGKDRFRVRAGPARDRAEAQVLQARVAATGNDAKVMAP